MLKLYRNIKENRLRLGLTQGELAKKVGYRGKSMIARIENGEVDLAQSKIEDFARVFGIPPGELMGWEDELTDSERRLLDLYRGLSDLGRGELIGFARRLSEEEAGEKDVRSG